MRKPLEEFTGGSNKSHVFKASLGLPLLKKQDEDHLSRPFIANEGPSSAQKAKAMCSKALQKREREMEKREREREPARLEPANHTDFNYGEGKERTSPF